MITPLLPTATTTQLHRSSSNKITATARNHRLLANSSQVRGRSNQDFQSPPNKLMMLLYCSRTAVTVPAGLVGGQTIHVAHPDGSGRLIKAEVPKGSKPGSIFYVKVPPAPSAPPAPTTTPSSTPIPPPIPPPAKTFNPHSPHQQSAMPSTGGNNGSAMADSTTAGAVDVLEERLIDAEYKIWKKNTPYL